MAKYIDPKSQLWKKWQRSGAIQTVLTFGDLALQFSNAPQVEVVTHNEPDDHIRDVWVSSPKAAAAIEVQLARAGYKVPQQGSEISNWAEEKYCWLPSKAKCLSCGGLNETCGIEADDTICTYCHEPTKGNWQEVYLVNGREILFKHVRAIGPVSLVDPWPQPPCVQLVRMYWDRPD
jgi:hypothetical protein